MFNPPLLSGEPSLEEGGPTGGGRRYETALRWLRRGAGKARPKLAKAGATALKALRNAGATTAAALERVSELVGQPVQNRKDQEIALQSDRATDQPAIAPSKGDETMLANDTFGGYEV